MRDSKLKIILMLGAALGAAYYAYIKSMFVISVSATLYFDIDVGINDIPGAVETGVFDFAFHFIFVALSVLVVWSGIARHQSFNKWVVWLLAVNCVYFLFLPIFMLAVGVPEEYALMGVIDTWVVPVGKPLGMWVASVSLFHSRFWKECRI